MEIICKNCQTPNIISEKKYSNKRIIRKSQAFKKCECCGKPIFYTILSKYTNKRDF